MVSRDHHAMNEDAVGGDSRLRRRYEELFELRETRPERDAAQAREALQKSHAASETLIASLRAELTQCKENAQPRNNVDAPEPQPSSSEAQLRAENAELRRELERARSASAAATAAAAAAAAAEPAKTGSGDSDATARLAF